MRFTRRKRDGIKNIVKYRAAPLHNGGICGKMITESSPKRMKKMNAKKILISLLALCLILASFSACGDKNKTPNETEQTTDAPVDITPVEIEDEGVTFG